MLGHGQDWHVLMNHESVLGHGQDWHVLMNHESELGHGGHVLMNHESVWVCVRPWTRLACANAFHQTIRVCGCVLGHGQDWHVLLRFVEFLQLPKKRKATLSWFSFDLSNTELASSPVPIFPA